MSDFGFLVDGLVVLTRGFGDFLVVERGCTFEVGVFRDFIPGLTRASDGFLTPERGFTYFLPGFLVIGFFLIVFCLASVLLSLSLFLSKVFLETMRPSLSRINLLFLLSVRSITTFSRSTRLPSLAIRLAVSSCSPFRGFLSTNRFDRLLNGLWIIDLF